MIHARHDELEALREQLTAMVDAGRAELNEEALEASSRRRVNGAILARTRRPATSRLRGRGPRVSAVAAVFAAAALVAIAVAPGGSEDGAGDRDRGPVGISRITPSASAAEALDQAGTAVVSEVDPAGTGPVWHGVSRSYVDGELASITEQWFDPSQGTYLAAAWGDQDAGEDRRELLQVVGVDAQDTSRLRTYERPGAAGEWQVPDEMPTPHLVQELPAGYGAGQRLLVTSVQRWLDVFESDPTEAEFVDATWAFGEATAEQYFGGEAPEFSKETMSKVGAGVVPKDVEEDMRAQVDAGADALRIRPMLYLLTTVQSTPEATKALYAQIGRFDTLERLPDETIDGRRVVRLRYDQVDLGSHRERVLVVDAATGVPVRTESVDRKSWTEIEPARRVAELGDDSVLCDEDVVPCDLLFGRGPVAAQWDEHVASDAGRRETEFLKDPNNAFSIAIPLRSPAPDDGIYGPFTGECARDARMLSVCRG